VLRLDWCSAAAAQHAVMRWHYSRKMPASKSARVGVWESEKFIGCIIFAQGGNRHLGAPYGLTSNECCELVRVALTTHVAPVSQIMAVALRMLHRQSPGLRLVVSFADPTEGHAGGIYQAGGWVYTGTTAPSTEFRLHGARLQKRSFTGANFGQPRRVLPAAAEKVKTVGKHRYLFPLDRRMERAVVHMAKPYPKKAFACAAKGSSAAPPPMDVRSDPHALGDE